jgi:hypothetical protein
LSSGKTGSDIGEVAAVTKFLILKETNSLPALAIKLGFKSAAGDGHSLRYTDSMGALFGLMAARDFHVGETNSVRTMRAFVELGFAVWDNGIDAYGFGGQDDATKFAAGLQFEPGEHIVVRGGIYGLNGWRHNGDTPVSANAAVEYTVSERTSAYMNLDIGLCKDADDYIIGGGLKVRFGKGGLPAPVTSAIPARPARATRTVPSPRPALITNAVPSRPAPVTRAVRSRPVPVTNAVPSRPAPVTNAIPAQPVPVANAIPAQPVPVANIIPTQPVPVTNAIPAQPAPVTNAVPAQPALVTNVISAEPVPVTNAIPAQPTPVTNVVPAQPAP